jgi:hypothetical protein
MDERVEALLADVLALEGEDPNVIREGGARCACRLRAIVPGTGSE